MDELEEIRGKISLIARENAIRKRQVTTEIAIQKRQVAENKKKLKIIRDAKKRLNEESVNRSSSGEGSPHCKQRLVYDNTNEEDNSSKERIIQHIPIYGEAQPSTSQDSDESFMVSTINLNDNMDELGLSTPERSDMTVMEERDTALSRNVVAKWVQCSICKKNQRRTVKK